MNYTHLHVHSHHSTFDGLALIPDLVDKAIAKGMNAIALTDHGNMEGVMELFNYCSKINGRRAEQGIAPFKPIAGCEVYCGKQNYHLILLAKNQNGYRNLCRIVTSSYQEGNYFNYKPHVDMELLRQKHEGIICCSACIGGEIPQKILSAILDNPQRPDFSPAEDALDHLVEIFGDDFYMEIQRSPAKKQNGNESVYRLQQTVNPILIDMAKARNIPIIATNDAHFTNEADAEAQDMKMCIISGKQKKDKNRIHFSRQEWLKSPDEMLEIFSDIPEALENTQLIVNKVELYDITAKPDYPFFPLPEGYRSAHQYLTDLVLQGARKRYGDAPNQAAMRQIQYELEVIGRHDNSLYFLIFWDLIRAAKEMGIAVAANINPTADSVVNYCLGITKIAPLHYNLCLERFINPDKYATPTITIFVEEGMRDKLADYLSCRYGKENMASIITFFKLRYDDAIKELKKAGATGDIETMAKLLTDVKIRSRVNSHSFVIAAKKIEEYMPLEVIFDKRNRTQTVVTQYDISTVMSAGVIEVDIIGIKH